MADDIDEPEDERAIELSTVSAIYPELVISPSDLFSAVIDILVEPIKPLAVQFPPLENEVYPSGPLTPPASDEITNSQPGTHSTQEISFIEDNRGQDVHLIAHLPSLTLKIHLPDGYPTQKPPTFNVQAVIPWLPEAKLKEIGDAGLSIWEDMGRDQVVFSYIDHLREEADQGFHLIQDSGAYLTVPQHLKIALLDFDLQAKRTKFEQETFDCGVCLEPKKGLICHRLLLCSHVFCVECLQDFFSACIKEGDVTNVKCLAPNCGVDSSLDVPSERRPGKKRRKREDRTLDPSELLQIPIDQELVQRYVKLKRKKKLESDRTTIYCPRQWCQGPARSKKSSSMSQDEGSDSDADIPEPPIYDQNTSEDLLPPPEERLAICEDCTFAFCKVCKASWHGEFFSCYPRRQNELTAEEKASEEYMKMHTTPCPTCDARCQKTMGCNHMICFKCNSHFCYLCSSWLDQNNPYEHFNTVKKPCYMRLWELEAGDGAEVGINFEGGADILNPIDDIQRPAPPPPPAPIPPPPPLAPLANPNRPNPEAVARNGPPDPGLQARQARRQARIQLRLRQQAAPARDLRPPMQGLQRFLQMVRNDEEDEWDSDELEDGDDREAGNDDDSDDDNNNDDDDDDRWAIPVR